MNLPAGIAAQIVGEGGRVPFARLAELGRKAARFLGVDRRASALRMLLDDQGVGGAFKVMLQVSE